MTIVVASGCASVDRSVQDRHFAVGSDGQPQLIVVWDSNLYPRFDAHVSQACFDAAGVGGPVPEGCVKPRHVLLEANPYRSAQGSASLASLLAMGALAVFAMRWIGWRPTVARDVGGRAAIEAEHAGSSDAVRLMYAVSGERRARANATAQGRDLPHPFAVGAVAGLAVLVPAVLLFGYGTALAWGVVTGVLTLLVLGLVELALLLPSPPHPADLHVPISRMLFLAGACVAYFVVALQAAFVSSPLLDLHGLGLFG